MSSARPLIIVTVVSVILMGLLSAGLKLVSVQALQPGCVAQTDSGLIDPSQTTAFYNNEPIPPLSALVDNLSQSEQQVLGTTTDEKWIEVDLSDQKLIAHQGNSIFLESPISSGLSFPTPSGTYTIWYKIRSTKMEGGSKANNTYYYLPNVPYSMFFKGSFGIHGTYWHNNFGRRMSHGCVNAPTLVAEKLFYWVGPQLPANKHSVKATADNPGTRVVVHP